MTTILIRQSDEDDVVTYPVRLLVWGPSIKYVMLFFTNFDPPSPCHTLSHIADPPIKYVTSQNTPPKDNPASICASELCKEYSYKYRVTAVLHCIVKKIVKKLTTN